MTEEATREESPKAPVKKKAAKKAAAPKKVYFAFGRPNYTVTVPVGSGGSRQRNFNGRLPIVEVGDPVEIEALRYVMSHSPGEHPGQFFVNSEIKEVAAPMSDEAKSLVTGGGNGFNRQAFDQVFNNVKRI